MEKVANSYFYQDQKDLKKQLILLLCLSPIDKKIKENFKKNKVKRINNHHYWKWENDYIIFPSYMRTKLLLEDKNPAKFTPIRKTVERIKNSDCFSIVIMINDVELANKFTDYEKLIEKMKKIYFLD